MQKLLRATPVLAPGEFDPFDEKEGPGAIALGHRLGGAHRVFHKPGDLDDRVVQHGEFRLQGENHARYAIHMQASSLLPRLRQTAFTGEHYPLGHLAPDASLPASLETAWRGANARLARLCGDRAGPDMPLRCRIADTRAGLPQLDADESYRLLIENGEVTLEAAALAGARHGLTTLTHLACAMQHEVNEPALPAGSVDDSPAFAWRGLMLDVARHFFSPDALHSTLDLMAWHKLNVLHLHLTDDQGFRFQSRAFPGLASRESYMQAELSRLVAAAADRGIRVLPELDMPGHVTSWLVACPEWGASRAPVSPSVRFGPHDAVLNPADEGVYAAIDQLIGEVAEVFPDPFLHIGGDEVDPAAWRQSDEISGFAAAHGLEPGPTLQAWFTQRVGELAARHGKRVIVWDEALAGPLPANAVVQSWRGASARDRALHAGHDCIVSAPYYLDLGYPVDLHHAFAPDAPEAELAVLEDALAEDPRLQPAAFGLRMLHGLWRQASASAPAGQSAGRILGGEACLWSELVTEPLLPVRLWSRMPALADRFWRNQLAPEELAAAVACGLARQAACGLPDIRAISRRLLCAFGIREAQLPAALLLEPIKWYCRLLGEVSLEARLQGEEAPDARPYDALTPLERPVDALLPESFEAHEFRRLLAMGGPQLAQQCRFWLAACRAGPWLPELKAPVAALAGLLAAVAELEDSGTAPIERALEEAMSPHGEYQVAIAPAVEQWLATHRPPDAGANA